MEDKKSSLYSLSNRMKNGWVQGGSFGGTVQGFETPAQETPAPQIVLPVGQEETHTDTMPVLPEITVMPETSLSVLPEMPIMQRMTLPVMPEMPIMPECTMLVMATIVKQEWNEIYDPDIGFERGTIFPCLDFPFVGEGACNYDRYE